MDAITTFPVGAAAASGAAAGGGNRCPWYAGTKDRSIVRVTPLARAVVDAAA